MVPTSANAPAQQTTAKPPFNAYTVNPEHYRDLNQKVKFATGYAMIEIEPFPRLKIMEIGRFCLENVKVGIPEDAVCRIYIEEYVKHIMQITHETPHILQLERRLGTDCIEVFIEQFGRLMHVIDMMREDKLWEVDKLSEDDIVFLQRAATPYEELEAFEKVETKVIKPLLK